MYLLILTFILVFQAVYSDPFESLILEKARTLYVQDFFRDPILLQDVEGKASVYKLPKYMGSDEIVYKRDANESEKEIIVFAKTSSDQNIYVVLRKNVLATRPTYFAAYAYIREGTASDPSSQTYTVNDKKVFIEWDTWGDRRDRFKSPIWTSCSSTIFLTCGGSTGNPGSNTGNTSANIGGKHSTKLNGDDKEEYELFKDLDFKTVAGSGRFFGSKTNTIVNVKTILHPYYVQQPQPYQPIYAQPIPVATPYFNSHLLQLQPPPPVYPTVPVVYPQFQQMGFQPVFNVPPMLTWVGFPIPGNYIPDDLRFRPVHGFLTPNPAGNPTTFRPDNPALAMFLPINQGTTGIFIPDGFALGANCHGAMLPSLYPGQPFLFVPNSFGFPGWFFPDNGAPRFHGFQIPGGSPGTPSGFIPDPSAFDLNPQLRYLPVPGTFQSDMPAGGGLVPAGGNIRVHGTLVPTMNTPGMGSPHMFILDYLGSPGFFRPDAPNMPPIPGFYVTGAQGSPPNFIPNNALNWPGNSPVSGSFVPSTNDNGVVPTGVDNIRGQMVFGKDRKKPMLIPEENSEGGTFYPANRIPPIRGYHIPGTDATPGVFVPTDDMTPIRGLTPGVFKPDKPDEDPVDGFLFKTPTKVLLIPKGVGSTGNFVPSDKRPIHGVLISGQHNLFYPDEPSRRTGAWLGSFQPDGRPPGPSIPGYLLGVANSQEPEKFLPNTNVYPGSFFPERGQKPIRGYFVTGTLGSPGKFIPDPETPVEINKPAKGTFQPENPNFPKIVATLMPSKKGVPPRFIPEEDAVPGIYSPDNKPQLTIHGHLVPNKDKDFPASFIPDDPDSFRDNFPHQIQPGNFKPDDNPEVIRGQMVPNMGGQSPIFIIDPMGIPGLFFPDKRNNFSMTGVFVPQKDQNDPGQLYLDDDRYVGTFQPLETTKGIFSPDKYIPGYPVHGKFTPQNPGKAPTFEIMPNGGGFPGVFEGDGNPPIRGIYFPMKNKKYSKFFPDGTSPPLREQTVPGKFVPDNLPGVTVGGKMKIPPPGPYPLLFKPDDKDKLPKHQKQELPIRTIPFENRVSPSPKITNKQPGSPGWFYPQTNPRNRVHGLLIMTPNVPVQFQPDNPRDFKLTPDNIPGSIVLDPPLDRTPLPGTMEVPENPNESPIFTPNSKSPNPSPPRGTTTPSKVPPPKGKPSKFFPDDNPGNSIPGYFDPDVGTFTPNDPRDPSKLQNKPTLGIVVFDDIQDPNPTSGTFYPSKTPSQPAKFTPKSPNAPKKKNPVSFIPDKPPNRPIKGNFDEDTSNFVPDNPSDLTRPVTGKIVSPSDPVGNPGTIYPPKNPAQPTIFVPSDTEPDDPEGQPGYFYPDNKPGNPLKGRLNPTTNMFTPDNPTNAKVIIFQPCPGRIVKDAPYDETPVPGTLNPSKTPTQPMKFVPKKPGGQPGLFYPDKSPNKPVRGTYYPPSSNYPLEFQPDNPSENPSGPGRLVLDPPSDQTPIPGSMKPVKDGSTFIPIGHKPSKTPTTGSPATFFLDNNPYFPIRGLYDPNGSPDCTFTPDEPANVKTGPGRIVQDPPEDPSPIVGNLDIDSSSPTGIFTPKAPTKVSNKPTKPGNPNHPSGGNPTWFYPDTDTKNNKIHGSFYPPNTFYPDNPLTDTPLHGVLIQELPEDQTPTFGQIQPSGTDQPATFVPDDPTNDVEPEDDTAMFVPDSNPVKQSNKRPCTFYPDKNPSNKIRGTYWPENFVPDNPATVKPTKGPIGGTIVPDPPDQTPIHGKLYSNSKKPGTPVPFKPEPKKIKITNQFEEDPEAPPQVSAPTRNPNAKIDPSKNMQMPPGPVNGVYFPVDSSNIFVPFLGTTGYFIFITGTKVHGSFYPFEDGPSNFVPDKSSELTSPGSGTFYPDIPSYLNPDKNFKNRAGIPGRVSISSPSILFTPTENSYAGFWFPKPTTACFSYNTACNFQMYDANQQKEYERISSQPQQKQKGTFFNSDGENVFIPESGLDGQFISDSGITITGLMSTSSFPNVLNYAVDDMDYMRNRLRQTQVRGTFSADSGGIKGSLNIAGTVVTFQTDIKGVKGSYTKGTEGDSGFMIYCAQDAGKMGGRALALENKFKSEKSMSQIPDTTFGWMMAKTEGIPKNPEWKFFGMGNCPIRKAIMNGVGDDDDIIDYYTVILRTDCIAQVKDRIKKLISEKILKVDAQVFVLKDHDFITRPKLTVEEFSDLSTAFELSVFSQTFKQVTISSETNKKISNSIHVLVEMGQRAILEAKNRIPAHNIRLIRNLILTMNTAFAKLCQDSNTMGTCTDCEAYRSRNPDDKAYLMGFIQYTMHGDRNTSFQNFIASNADYISGKVELGCNVI